MPPLPAPNVIHPLFPRQTATTTTTAPPANTALPYLYSGVTGDPSPGTVVGILLGSVGGFLLLLWLLSLCNGGRSSSGSEDELVVRPARHSQSSRRSHSPPRRRSRSREEVVEVRRGSPRVERVIVEERREERDSDIVEVFEEAPRRSRSGRGGFRTVVPDEFAGGNRPVEEVYRKGSKRSTRRG
ncbi:MAG: hypothetical protein M1829_004137 [Trizodia sp. TS-e1964]|nr:MAG: hypothetical protein M1829_004137 [Trizodia sp. TS-e1964]